MVEVPEFCSSETVFDVTGGMASEQEGPGSSAVSKDLAATPQPGAGVGAMAALATLLQNRCQSAREAVSELANLLLDLLDAELDTEFDPCHRVRCGLARVFAQCRPLLRDDLLDPDMRATWAFALGRMERAACIYYEVQACEEAVFELVHELANVLRDTDPKALFLVARRFCFEVELKMGSAACEGAVPKLLNLLQDTNVDPGFRCIVGEVLGKMGAAAGEGAVPKLLDLLRDTELDPKFRIPVAWILGEMGPAACEAVPELVNLLLDTNLDPAVRSAVAWSLTKLGTVREFVSQLPAVVGAVPELVNLLKDRNLDPELSRSLAWTLGKLAPESTAEEILKNLRDPHLDQRVRCHLARVFAQMGPGAVGAVPQLISVLRDTDLDPEVRKSLACALGEMGPAISKEQLVDLLQDPNIDSELRRSLASGFRLESVTLLMELLADPSLSQEHSLLREALKRIIDGSALITCMDEKTLDATVSQLKHASPEVQNIVLPLISKMGGPQAAEALKVLETAESEQESQDQQGWDNYLEQLNRLTGGPSAPSESTSESTAIGSDLVSEATAAASSTAQAARDEQIPEDDIAPEISESD